MSPNCPRLPLPPHVLERAEKNDIQLVTDVISKVHQHYNANDIDVATLIALMESPLGYLKTDMYYAIMLNIVLTQDIFVTSMASYLISKCPSTARCADRLNMLPLHHVCLRNVEISLVELLLSIYPEALCANNNHNETPLHLLITNNSISAATKLTLLTLFLRTAPHLASLRTSTNKLPIHLALNPKITRLHPDIISLLLSHYPVSLHEATSDTSIRIGFRNSNSEIARSEEKWTPHSRILSLSESHPDVYTVCQRTWTQLALQRIHNMKQPGYARA